MWNPFKRPASPETSVLPVDVAEVIESAFIIERSCLGDDGMPRIFIIMPGRQFFIENAERSVREKWPELNSAQVRRAVSWLKSRSVNHMKAREMPKPTKPQWKDWEPLKTLEGFYDEK